jgi:hypothetical protein
MAVICLEAVIFVIGAVAYESLSVPLSTSTSKYIVTVVQANHPVLIGFANTCLCKRIPSASLRFGKTCFFSVRDRGAVVLVFALTFANLVFNDPHFAASTNLSRALTCQWVEDRVCIRASTGKKNRVP